MTYKTDHSARKYSGIRCGFAVVLVAAIGLAMPVAQARPGDSASSTNPATGITTTSVSNPDGSHTITRTDADGNVIPDGNEAPAEQSDSGGSSEGFHEFDPYGFDDGMDWVGLSWEDFYGFDNWIDEGGTDGSDDTAGSGEPGAGEYGPDDATWAATSRARVARAAAEAAKARADRLKAKAEKAAENVGTDAGLATFYAYNSAAMAAEDAAWEAENRARAAEEEEAEQKKQATISAAAEANRRNSVLRGLQAVQIQNTIRIAQRPHIPQVHRAPPVYRAPVEMPRRVIVLSVGPSR